MHWKKKSFYDADLRLNLMLAFSYFEKGREISDCLRIILFVFKLFTLFTLL